MIMRDGTNQYVLAFEALIKYCLNQKGSAIS